MCFNWKHLFDWTPVAVTEPRPGFYKYKDIGNYLIGYEVVVKYKYHGYRKYFFVINNDKLAFVDAAWLKRRADKFCAKINRQIAKGR